MLKKSGFQLKIFLFYSITVLTIIIMLTSSFYYYVYKNIESNSKSYFLQIVEKVSSNIDNLVFNLDVVSTQLIASNDLQEIFGKVERSWSKSSNYFDENPADRKTVQSIFLSISSPKDRVRKISIYNSPTNFISIGNTTDFSKSEIKMNYKKWSGYFNKYSINFKILPSTSDTFSLIRPFTATYSSYNTLGIIVLQQQYSKIEDICNLEDAKNGLKLYIIDDEYNIIYPQQMNSPIESRAYIDSVKNAEPGTIYSVKNPLSNQSEFVSYANIEHYPSWHVVLTQPKALFEKPAYTVLKLILLLCLLFMLITIVIIFISTRSLMRPIRELRESLESVTFENTNISISPTHNEIENLKDAFNEMFKELKESASKTIQSQANELQAHFLALQAQINPHFLYNSIMSISAAGQEAGNEKVQIMCSQLGEMYRYIGSMDNSSITIQDELKYAELYLKFIKWRYEDRLDYSLEIEDRMFDIVVPKLIIQPIIENCFSHGFVKVRPPYEISIKGYCLENAWFIDIIDNGQGFTDAAITEIRSQMKRIDHKILSGKITNELKVGGLALINIYTRLKLLYNDKAVFKIENLYEGGSKITIGGACLSDNHTPFRAGEVIE
jgi:two-component system, sensor histidine kinase YesM